MSSPKMQVIATRVAYQGRVIRLEVDEVVIAGQTRFYDRVVHPGAVVILPIAADGRILFIDQYRQALGARLLELPAGTLEPGEDPQVCAARELTEEVQCRAGHWTPLGRIYPAPGFCNEVQYLFAAQDISPHCAKQDDDEDISLCPLTLAEADSAILNGRLCDAKSIAIIMRARLAGVLPS